MTKSLGCEKCNHPLFAGVRCDICGWEAEQLHTCSYSCTRPPCVLAQRNELRETVNRLIAENEELRAECNVLVRQNGEWQEKVENDIQAKGPTAPRITPADIEANIVSEHYFTARDGRLGALTNETYVGREKPQKDNSDLLPLELLTFCVLVLRNGFTVTGESACASPENVDTEIGRKIARANALNKVWPLMGYALKERLGRKA